MVYHEATIHLNNAANTYMRAMSTRKPGAVINDVDVSGCVAELRMELLDESNARRFAFGSSRTAGVFHYIHVALAWFTPLVNLKQLNLSHNLLTTLPADLTEDLKVLDTLDLSHNHFRKLSLSWFSTGSPLQHLNVSDNKLENVTASTHEALALFGERLMALRTLDLSRNQLHSVPGLEGLQKLRWLWLHQNLLTTLPTHAFANNTVLEHFSLSGNPWRCDEEFAKRRNKLLHSLTSRVANHGPGIELHDVVITECASPPEWKVELVDEVKETESDDDAEAGVCDLPSTSENHQALNVLRCTISTRTVGEETVARFYVFQAAFLKDDESRKVRKNIMDFFNNK
ncbi:hypothetical protein HPB51_020265 [Rhipicephalus microplus]|uniref:Uncharacterized protein n=1 Tax=Rhipicephalus microplus TaxID=6941 RepID=A0A9J6EV41_RHIMP|nr:hypothetical protein HPB51_020265 [Rhipicephalus microplus]